MPEINFGLLQPVDVGALTQQGFSTGMAMVKHVQTQNALKAYLANPDDPQAYNALAAYDPNAAATIQQQQLQRRKYALEATQLQARQTAGTQAAGGDVQGGMATALSAGDTEFATALSKLDDTKKKQLSDMYKGAAPFAYQALKLPYEQRKAYVQQIAPQLEAAGWTPDKVAAFDPTDANLGSIVQGNMTLEQAMARDKTDYREVLPGARLVPFDSTGRPITNDSGGVAPTPTGGSSTSHNNPGALRKPGSSEFQSFATPEAGIAAQEALLGRYMQRGLNNVNSIVETYAPRQSHGGDNTDAQVENYKAYVAHRLGVNPVDALSPAVLPKLAAAMREFETGHRATASASNDPATIRVHAQEAIAAGADPAQVKARAAAMGVEL
jgi:hypothetical protein